MRETGQVYADTGCRHFAFCLDCPLPSRLDEVAGAEKSRMLRDQN